MDKVHFSYFPFHFLQGSLLARSTSVDSSVSGAGGGGEGGGAAVTVSVATPPPGGREDVGMRPLAAAAAAALDGDGGSGGVLHRVGHQQSKWQRAVREQRKNIYDRRTILN